MKPNRVDKTADILDKWNKRKLSDRQTLTRLFELYRTMITPGYKKAEKPKKKCKTCDKMTSNMTFCSKECGYIEKVSKHVM